MKSEAPSSKRSTKGALYVEFLIVFMPMFCFFLCLVQFMYLEIASILVKHAAVMATRAAIVVLPDNPDDEGGAPVGSNSGGRKEAIQKAAESCLRTLDSAPGAVQIQMQSSYERDELVEVNLTYDYKCKVPFGKIIVCEGNPGEAWWNGFPQYRPLYGKAALPNQGADYHY